MLDFLKKKNPDLHEYFWSDGYFVCIIGDASPETIKKYIDEQG